MSVGRGSVRVEGGLQGKHGTVGAVPAKEHQHHGGRVLQRTIALRRRLGAGKAVTWENLSWHVSRIGICGLSKAVKRLKCSAVHKER